MGLDVEISWQPFYLDPTLPKGKGVKKLDRYRAKFPEAQLARMIPMMAAVGASLSPPVKFSYGGNIGHTRDSHRLAEWAMATGGWRAQHELMEAMMQAYFVNEKSMGEHSVLVECATKAGLDAEEAARVLRDDEYGDEVDEGAAKWMYEHGIRGVPFFRVQDGLYEASGAQDEAWFVEKLGRIAKRLGPKPEPAEQAAPAAEPAAPAAEAAATSAAASGSTE
jgi:predicted DsbA family dithiol-disulfide isomerase